MALLAVPVPPTNLTTTLGFLLLPASGPLHKLCPVPATLFHTPDTCYLLFILRSAQVSSSERDLPHLIWDPHVLPGPPDLCLTPLGCCSCPNENIGPSREGSRRCACAHHSGLSMSHLVGAQCLLNRWRVLPHLILCETGKGRASAPEARRHQGLQMRAHSGVKPSSSCCLLAV